MERVKVGLSVARQKLYNALLVMSIYYLTYNCVSIAEFS